jgi:hypothetical protein
VYTDLLLLVGLNENKKHKGISMIETLMRYLENDRIERNERYNASSAVEYIDGDLREFTIYATIVAL